MEQDISQKFEELDKKIEATYKSVEKMRKYFLWTMIITIVMIVLPVIGLLFAIPQFLSVYNTMGNL